MKTTYVAGLVVLVAATLSSCESKDNQIIGDKVAGTWKIERIRFSNPNRLGVDTTLVLNGSQITFESCTFKDGASTNCPGRYQVLGTQAVPFNFMALGNQQKAIGVSGAGRSLPENELFINGNYELSFGGDGKLLEMKGSFYRRVDAKTTYDETAYYTLRKQ